MQLLPVVAVVVCSAVCSLALNKLDYRYHNYTEMSQFLQKFTKAHPNLARIYSIGKSVQGRELLVVELTAAKAPLVGVPNVKLIGNIHGNEAVGREVLLHFLEYLVMNYYNGTDKIRWLLNNTRIHVLPSLNPDGFEMASEGLCTKGLGRENAHNVDLNRCFPDFFKKNKKGPEPEAEAVQQWMKQIPFILSASLHGGALVANYPYENTKEDAWELALRWLSESSSSRPAGEPLQDAAGFLPWKALPTTVSMPLSLSLPPSVSPDDDVFRHLATVYATRHPHMHRGQPCDDRTTAGFPGGITNGAAWYPITGGMQDYNYVAHGCMEITMEISCCKYPPAWDLPTFWEENKLALLDFISQAHGGVKGQVVDGLTNTSVVNASLRIVGRDMTFYSTSNGQFWRILLPGNYQLEASAKNYQTRIFNFTVLKYNNDSFPQMTSKLFEIYPMGYKIPTTSTEDYSSDAPTDVSTSASEALTRAISNNTTDISISTKNIDDSAMIVEVGLVAAVKSSTITLSHSSFLLTIVSVFVLTFDNNY